MSRRSKYGNQYSMDERQFSDALRFTQVRESGSSSAASTPTDKSRKLTAADSEILRRPAEENLIQYMPEDILVYVLGFLSHKDLCLSVMPVCRSWRELSMNTMLWKALCKRQGVTEITEASDFDRNHSITRVGSLGAINSSTTKKPPTQRTRSSGSLSGSRNKFLSKAQLRKIAEEARVNYPTASCGNRWKDQFMYHVITHNRWMGGMHTVASLTGHKYAVWCVKIVGNFVYAGGDDHTVRKFNATTGKTLATFHGHTDAVLCVDADTDVMVSGSKDTDIRVWNPVTGKCRSTISGAAGWVWAVQLHGAYVVSGGRDKVVRAHVRETGQVVRELRGHTGDVLSVCAVGDVVASGGEDASVRVWSLQTGECTRVLAGHEDAVQSVRHDRKTLVSASEDGDVRLWKLKSGECKYVLNDGEDFIVRSVYFDKRKVVTAGDGAIRVWDRTNLNPTECTQCIQLNTVRVPDIDVFKDHLVCALSDGTVRIYDYTNNYDQLVVLDDIGSPAKRRVQNT